jgi:two-component system chemotaxis sensor kinase CheA
MTIDLAQFHQVFFEESFEGLSLMETGLLAMDPGAVDAEEINAIFRAAHSIKGGSGTFGFDNIASFTHVMETLLDEMRDGRRAVTAEALEVLLQSVDILREMLHAALGEGELDEGRVAEQQQALESVLQGEAQTRDEVDESADARDDTPATKGWHIVFRPLPNLMRTGNDPLRIIRELAALGALEVKGDASLLPDFEQFDPEECYLSWDLHLFADVERSVITEIFDWVEDECDLAIMPIVDAQASVSGSVEATAENETSDISPPAVQKEVERRSEPDRRQEDRRRNDQQRTGAAAATSSIRVGIDKIDRLINMVGELVITQSMLSMLGENFHPGNLDKLQDGLEQMARHTRELQESVMQIRMLPISFTFSRFPRLVHDLGRQLGKKIDLKLTGENTELDKTVIEKIGDPLVHLVRNSLDHGIETPEERLAAGKPETGTIELKAFHQGGSIVIEIRDDGRGLDADRLYSKALERGVIGVDEKLSTQQIHELIFQPGFSTAEQVSDVSGRGVGMDVVRRNILELGGSIEIESEPGRGTGMVIRLPLTLAILDGQTIAVGGEVYIIPLISIIESIKVAPEMVNLVAGRGETFKLRDEYLPIIRMHEVFNIEGYRAHSLTDGLLVVVEGEGRRCGVLVDELIGQQQVVIKSLEANYEKVDGVSGATILGDGSVALILDIPGLIRLATRDIGLQLIRKTA